MGSDERLRQLAPTEAATRWLLVNELISNCLKHRFPTGDTGRVIIELRPLDTVQQGCLRVSDTGVGQPPDFDEKRKGSLGLQLVSDLAEQLNGELSIAPNPNGGTAFSVTFQVIEPAPLVMPAGTIDVPYPNSSTSIKSKVLIGEDESIIALAAAFQMCGNLASPNQAFMTDSLRCVRVGQTR